MRTVVFLVSSMLPAVAGLGSESIRGVVESAQGVEPGVWVIAETTALPTKFVKSVVTDENGRFVIPDLPEATYKVWVRGYGLVDSDPVDLSPGREVSLEAKVAPTPREAARVYPANYWYSLIEPPKASEFPGSGAEGNGIHSDLKVQGQWIDIQKQGCMLCHQLGNHITREIENIAGLDSSIAAWDHRVQMGQRGGPMSRVMSRFGRDRGLRMFAEWTDRIAEGEVPPAPPRPQGVERNLVVTMWEWGNEIDYIHDEIATDKRDPTVNANGPIYGVNISNDELTILDPVKHTARSLKVPLRDDPSTVPSMIPQAMPRPARYHREKLLWTDPANPHNPMLDGQGRVWMTTAIRGRDNPDWCKEGSSHPSAKYFPLERSIRQAGYYDPEIEKFVLIDTCYGTHHLQFAEDDDDTLWFSGDRQAIGWLNTRKYDETGDERASQGWCPTVIDTNGDGKIGKWVEPGELHDPELDTRISVGSYGIIPSPVDDAVWIASTRFPGRLARLDRGKNPPETCIAEVYEVPSVLDSSIDPRDTGFGPRGLDVDRKGVVWTALSGSSHFASFDRRKCTVLNGPAATGRHCPEGWSLYETPGPTMKGTTPPVRADYHYYSWVDQFDTLGLGENIPIANGSNSDSLLALMPDTGKWVVLRVPYPRGAFTRGLDGRIDDPDAGWKGRGVWVTYGAAATWHIEGGKGVKPGLLRLQIRPSPLAN